MAGAAAHVGNADGRLADNVIHFVRLLRACGLPVGPAQAIGALEALQAAGLGEREDFYWILHATLVTRRAHRPVFDQAFHLFWQRRGLIEKMMSLMMLEAFAERAPEKPKAAALRVAQALSEGLKTKLPERELVEMDAQLTMSDREVLQKKDFEQMSAAEMADAVRRVRALVLPCDRVRTRRFRVAARGPRIDQHATLRQSLRAGGNIVELVRSTPRLRHPPVVALIDISGSMAAYTRPILHFLHTLAQTRPHVSTFLFGTRLTNVTRHLMNRDPDEALAGVAGVVEDWAGGTRIASTLAEFNKIWSRRVLGQGAVVLLVTDGLERDTEGGLSRHTERLAKSCRRLVWLNPLLRFDGFEARAAGIRAMLPHVDEFRPVHNLESLAALADALSAPDKRDADPRRWLKPVHAA